MCGIALNLFIFTAGHRIVPCRFYMYPIVYHVLHDKSIFHRQIRNFYTCPGKFEEEGELDVCGHGMHFCQVAADCFNYYSFNSENKVAEVIAYGEVRTDGDKSCTDKLEIVREIPWDEVLRIVNIGKNCTGNRNTGNRNTGDCNTGDWNKSSFNTGCFNTEEQKIMLFNKPSDMTYREWMDSYARYLLNQIPKDVVEWVYEEDMTDEEIKILKDLLSRALKNMEE